jgi:transcriptional regulator with XRE-family HTH domain
MTYADVISGRILSLCEKRKITVNKLATLSGLTQSTINSILKGTTKSPQLKTLHIIASALGMTVSEFLNFPEMDELCFEDLTDDF